ncbi:MAG: M48 family metalloprotease [Imperialibacter sp.]|uniref:M48 family metalloprotease n=1 Tax=Imperialibacter sp. TaxID=2038411 RepID=UPI003A8C21B3
MIQNTVTLSSEFKSQATRAVLSIILFIFTYVVLVILALGLTALCVYGGIMLIITYPRLITILLGAGLASLGILVLIFMVKFVTKSHKADRSHLTEITKADEPELFNMIQQIVDQVGTSFPKRVYLSGEVNASVFYDSSFWSMFFPVKKNLQIGLALINTLTLDELRGVLAHEFGHFSQRTMKVGSYAYNVNQVIYNMLYDNESYDGLIQSWASVSGYFVPFVQGALKIIMGIQWVLSKIYGVVNISYMGLSRQMEFHADEIAAHVTGYAPLRNALLRLELADYSYNTVLNYYGDKVDDKITSENLYKEQAYVMQFTASETQAPIVNGFPQVTLDEQKKFNKSRLVIKDQWASHPSTEERVERLEKTNIEVQTGPPRPAITILKDPEATQKRLTEKLFSVVQYAGPTVHQPFDVFTDSFQAEQVKNSFDKRFNGYYDRKNPIKFDLNKAKKEASVDVSALFADEKLDMVYTSIALQNDIETITQIATGAYPMKTFDYDGKKYKKADGFALVKELKLEQEQVDEAIKQNDMEIYAFFRQRESAAGSDRKLAGLYSDIFAYDEAGDERVKLYSELINATQFVSTTTPFDVIDMNFKTVKKLEDKMKAYLGEFLNDPQYTNEISTEMRETLEAYVAKDLIYFMNEQYLDSNLQKLFQAANYFYYLVSRAYFLRKKALVDYQATLLEK